MNKLLIVCGPTAVGKTDLAVSLARQFNGELVNADSRQVYRGMDIGTGKGIPKTSNFQPGFSTLSFPRRRESSQSINLDPPVKPEDDSKSKLWNKKLSVGYRKKDGIPIWLVDIVDPTYPFNVGEYVSLAREVIQYLWSQGKLPIIVGGTGLYISSLLSPPETLHIPPDPQIRKTLEGKPVGELIRILHGCNPTKLEQMNASDRKNPRRLIRAIEVATVPSLSLQEKTGINADTCIIGLTAAEDGLAVRVDKRVEQRMKQGLLYEIQNLLNQGYDWDFPSFSSIGYSEWKEYFQLSAREKTGSVRQDIINTWKLHEKQYAKRQMTWFRKQSNIAWFDVAKPDYKSAIVRDVGRWYTLERL